MMFLFRISFPNLRCVQNLVDHLDFISPPVEVLQFSPAHVKLEPVASNILRATSSPLFRRNHAQHLLIGVGPLLVHLCLEMIINRRIQSLL